MSLSSVAVAGPIMEASPSQLLDCYILAAPSQPRLSGPFSALDRGKRVNGVPSSCRPLASDSELDYRQAVLRRTPGRSPGRYEADRGLPSMLPCCEIGLSLGLTVVSITCMVNRLLVSKFESLLLILRIIDGYYFLSLQ